MTRFRGEQTAHTCEIAWLRKLTLVRYFREKRLERTSFPDHPNSLTADRHTVSRTMDMALVAIRGIRRLGSWRNTSITFTLRELKPAEVAKARRFSRCTRSSTLFECHYSESIAKEQSRAMTLTAVPMAAVRIQSVKRTRHWFLAQTGQS